MRSTPGTTEATRNLDGTRTHPNAGTSPGPPLDGPSASREPVTVVEPDGQTSSVELESNILAPRDARRFLRETLGTWKLDGFGDVTELLTDELVSNVVRHVGSPIQVRATRRPSSIRIEVHDASSEPPVRREQSLTADNGRGIQLVESLSTAWGVDVDPDGKTVWFEIDCDEATEEVHGD